MWMRILKWRKLKDALIKCRIPEFKIIVDNSELNKVSLETMQEQIRATELIFQNQRSLQKSLHQKSEKSFFQPKRKYQEQEFHPEKTPKTDEEIFQLQVNKVNKFQQRCSHCNKTGHEEDKCWALHPELKEEFYKMRGSPSAKVYAVGKFAKRNNRQK